ncbi:MAG: transcription termination/antitermination protein NusA [Rickettsiales bacterium]|nr:transcription termination/antitermination protein NusA [Rickettsiales bacterium]
MNKSPINDKQDNIFPVDLLDIAKNLAKEKGIDSEEVLEAMETAIAKAGRSKYGHEFDIRAHVDRDSGQIGLYRYLEIVDSLDEQPDEEKVNKIQLSDAIKTNKELKVGEYVMDKLPQIDFGRIAVQTAKQVIVQKVKEAERSMQYAQFKDKIGEIVNGIVKRVEYGNVVVDLGRAEALMKREELLNRETFRRSDRIRAYIMDVREELKGPQIFLSRSHNQFLVKLFTQEVPEIYDGIIEVKSVARDPGSRAKIAVFSKEKSIDPVGACVGMRGSRVQAVVNELQGEKIDIVLWSEDIATFVVNALGPAEVDKVIIEEELKKVDIIVPDEQLSLAIGRRGQNVRLASAVTGWDIDILTVSQESDRRNEEFKRLSQLFISSLDVDEVIAHLLVTEGFSSVEDVSMVTAEELSSIEGFDDNLVKELKSRAALYLKKIEKEDMEKVVASGIDDYMSKESGFNAKQLIELSSNNIKTRDNLADLSSDELIEILSNESISEKKANEIIMNARKHWFEKE